MIYKEYNVSQSAGVILGSTFSLGEKVYPKGHEITSEDILTFKMYGLHFIYGAEYQDGDVEYKTAYTQIAAAVCGKGLGYVVEGENCLITALEDGIFLSDKSRIDKFNSYNENIIINTIAPLSVVKKGDTVAELNILPPLLTQQEIDDLLFRLAGNFALLSLSANRQYRAAFVYPHILGNEDERRHSTSITMRLLQGLADLHFDFTREIECGFNLENLANAFYQGNNFGADVLFISSPLKGYGANDLLFQALRSLTDDIYIRAVPYVGAADLMIAEKSGRRIIVLPYDYDKTSDNFIDDLIKQAIFSEHLSEAIFAHKQTPIISQIKPTQHFDKVIAPQSKGSADKAKIGAVILAAGQGRRAGLNKLMVEGQDGLPMFMHAVNAAIASQAKPVFVITGYRHEELEEWLDKLDVNVIYNPAFESGVKTSIRLGLKAMPSSCDGALLIPADMPNLGAAEINKLIAKFDTAKDKQLVFFTHKGVKQNPLIWSKSLYDKADLVPENSEFRVVFAEHADYSKAVELKDASKLLDINFPNDIKEYAKK